MEKFYVPVPYPYKTVIILLVLVVLCYFTPYFYILGSGNLIFKGSFSCNSFLANKDIDLIFCLFERSELVDYRTLHFFIIIFLKIWTCRLTHFMFKFFVLIFSLGYR